MALKSDGESSPKRRRVDEEGEQGAAAEVAEDCISQLPKEVLLSILRFLPLTSAIRTGALSTVWRGLWRRRWLPPSSLRLRVSDRDTPERLVAPLGPRGPHRVSQRDTPERLLALLELRGTRRVDRFSLTFFREGDLERADFRRFLDYAAACAAEDLLIHFVYHDPEFRFNDVEAIRTGIINGLFTFRFPQASPFLARVSLRGVTVNLPLDGAARPFSALAAIHLHSVEALDGSVHDLVAACPRLHTLDLRDCRGSAFRVVDVRPAGARLRSLTVARCDVVKYLFADTAGLRSFRYSGHSLIRPSCILANAPLDDLCISFREPFNSNFNRAFEIGGWFEAIANFSNLTVLTICSSSLPIAPASAIEGLACLFAITSTSIPGSALNLHRQDLRELHVLNLRELHLLIFDKDDAMPGDIYEFFTTYRCPQLERLFMQLPLSWYQRKSSKINKSSEDMEIDSPFDELSEEEASVEELSQEEQRKELPLEELSQEEASVDEPREDKMSVDELGVDKASVDEQSKDELREDELLEDGLDNLVLVKIVNFNGLPNQMKLVSYLLRKATSLNKLLLVAPKQKDWLDKLHHLEMKLLLLRKASENAQIILKDSDDAAIQPVHSKVTAEFF